MATISETLCERGKTHGDFKEVADTYSSIKKAIFKNKNNFTEDEVLALDMIAQKLARIANGDPHFIDHWHDIAGYATLVECEIVKNS